MRKDSITLLLTFSVCMIVSLSAKADWGRDHRGYGHDYEGRRHWEARHYGGHDIDLWRNGRWIRRLYNGRIGWWWVVGANWYFYDAPIYPVPQPYSSTVVVEETTVSPFTQLPPVENNYDYKNNYEEVDDKKLDRFAEEFYRIDPKGYSARSHLLSLKDRLKSFKNSLYNRGYNATHILKDVDRLMDGIDIKLNQVR